MTLNKYDQLVSHIRQIEMLDSLEIFFRADDLGMSAQKQSELCKLFLKHEIPVCLAVVPVWMTHSWLYEMSRDIDFRSEIFCWHQHGFAHMNHNSEYIPYKSEFSNAQSYEQKYNKLLRGSRMMDDVFGDYWKRVFTPPWNHLDDDTLDILHTLDYVGKSQCIKSAIPHHSLVDKNINVDFVRLNDGDVFAAFKTGAMGIMIHPDIMTEIDFIVLDYFLTKCKKLPNVKIVDFSDM